MPRIVLLSVMCVTTAATAAAGAVCLSSASAPRTARPASAPAAPGQQLLFGDASVRRGISNTSPGRATAFGFRSTRTGIVTSITLYVDRRTRASGLVVGLYGSHAGVPDRALALARHRAPRRGHWNTVRVRPTQVRAGGLYWLAVLGTGGRLYFRDPPRARCASPQSRQASLTALPRVWHRGRFTSSACLISAYVRGHIAARAPGGATATAPFHEINCAGTAGSGTVDQSSLDACGFPSMDTTGPADASRLTNSGGFTASTPGAVYNQLNVTGGITVAANDVTIENSNITDDDLSNAAIIIQNGVTGTKILNDSIHGSDTGNNALAFGVSNLYGSTLDSVTIDHTNFYNGDRILVGYGTVTDSYCLGGASFGSEHDECVYTSGGAPGISLVHDTLLNANPYQTAAVFVDSPDGSGSDGQGTVNIQNSLLGGGGYCIYGGEGSAGTHHTGPESITNNRFAGLYFSGCGQFGALAYMPTDLVWSGNVWDATNRPVPAP